ncbi:MAG: phosphohydrolase [Clostridia bacterium]
MSFFTNSGKMINMENVDINAIEIEDIAHGLSLTSRASGQFTHFYSVAQHSINCMREAKARGFSDRVCFAALLHDGSEAYLCDIPTPLKSLLNDYKKIEKDFQEKIMKKFNLYPLTKEEERLVKTVDEAMLYYEFKKLHTIPICFEKTPILCSTPVVEYMDMNKVEKEFLNAYSQYKKVRLTA